MDYTTLYLILQTSLLIQTVVLLQTWRQNPEEIGLRDWGLAAAMLSAGSLLVVTGLAFTPNLPETPTPGLALALRDVGSTVGTAGLLLAWIGIRHFYQLPPVDYRWVLVYLVVYWLILLPGSHLPGWRVLASSLAFGILALLIARVIHRAERQRSLFVYMAIGAMLLVSVAWLTRGTAVLDDLQRASGSHLIDQLCIYSSIVMSMVFTMSLMLITNQRIHARLHEQASRDPLTGALNRRAFYDASHPLLAALKRQAVNLAVCVIDLDHFKRLNDRYGHAAGDEVLRQFADMARANLRDGDLFARYGGEEFVALLQGSGPAEAEQVLDRLHQACANLSILVGDDELKLTFSAGISHARGPAEADLERLLKDADDALYRAKDTGRNRTEVHPLAVTGLTASPQAEG